MLPVRLDRDARQPLPVQLSGRIRALVADGTLARGDRLPSTRALALDLGTSRAVTEQAYEQLVAEGWLEARRGSGTFVAADGAQPARARPGRPPATVSTLVRLDTGTPWIDPRHSTAWRRAWREVSTARPPSGYDDPAGLPELRLALVEHLARTRGLRLEADEVVVTAGTTDGWRQLLTVLPAGPVAVEDPGYRAAAETVRGDGRVLVDVPAGSPPEQLDGLRAIYTTPAHQHPLGRVMPAAERVALLAAAAPAGTLVVEDDYDSEFRYDVAPVPALATLDPERVAYLGTAAKSVGPSLRLGWMVLPAGLREAVLRRRATTHDVSSWPAQRAMVSLLRDGYLDQVVRTARRVYARRAQTVAAALGPHAELAGPLAGMYSTWLLPEDAAVRARDAARAAGFEVNLLSAYCRSADLTGLVVGFGGVTDERLEQALAALVSALRR